MNILLLVILVSLAVVTIAAHYAFIYLFLSSIKNNVNIAIRSLLLLLILMVARVGGSTFVNLLITRPAEIARHFTSTSPVIQHPDESRSSTSGWISILEQ